MSLSRALPWPRPPVASTGILVPITSWGAMLEEVAVTGVEFDGFWLDCVESRIACLFRWLGEPRATVLATWEDRMLTDVECRGIGDRQLSPAESATIASAVHAQFAHAGYLFAAGGSA